jgi:hypothetical protein
MSAYALFIFTPSTLSVKIICLNAIILSDYEDKMLETNPPKIPVVLLQIQFERLMLQAIGKLRRDLEVSIKQLEGTIYDNK